MSTQKFAPTPDSDEHVEYERIRNTARGFIAIVRVRRGKFAVVEWNAHHNNWVRDNREQGMAYHCDLRTLVNDNLHGGIATMPLWEAREETRDPYAIA